MTEKKEFRKIITPVARLSYPALLAAKKNELSGKEEFSCVLLFKKGEDLAALKTLIRQAGEGKWGKDQAKWPRIEGLPPRMPLRDQGEKADEHGKLPDGYVAGAMFATLRSNRPPGVIGPDNARITSERDIYPGCWVKASVTAYAYGGPGTKFRAGISLGLQNIQKQKDDSPFGAPSIAPEEEFKPVEGSEASESDSLI